MGPDVPAIVDRRLRLIMVKTVPHHEQRYDTCGDWQWDKNGAVLMMSISRMKDQRHEWLVTIHELVEALLCRISGVTQSDVDKFDLKFEKDRHLGKHDPGAEPGEHPEAPYRYQHLCAVFVEKLLAWWFDVDWADYEQAILKLEWRPNGKTKA